jgi:WD40 repeat protein
MHEASRGPNIMQGMILHLCGWPEYDARQVGPDTIEQSLEGMLVRCEESDYRRLHFSFGGKARQWNACGEWIEKSTPTPRGFSGGGIWGITKSRDDNVIRVFELSTGKERKLVGHTQQIHGAVFTPDSKRILSGSYDQTVRMWDVESGKDVCRFFGHTNWVFGVAVSPDGKLGMSGSKDKTVRLWKLPK